LDEELLDDFYRSLEIIYNKNVFLIKILEI